MFLTFLLWICLAGVSPKAEAKPLSDGITGSLTTIVEPGLTEFAGQQNLHPRFGLLAGYKREDYQGAIYSGWEIGSNWLVGRMLSEKWQANAVFTLGLSGMRGPVHDHSAIWTALDADWETRRVLFAIRGSLQRGNRMPRIDEGQIRAGYSPLEPDLNGIQPWVLLSWFTRSGTGKPQTLALLRLLSGAWWLELGSSLSTDDRFLSFAISL